MPYGSPDRRQSADPNYTPGSIFQQEKEREDSLSTMQLDAHRREVREDADTFVEKALSLSPQREGRRYGSASPAYSGYGSSPYNTYGGSPYNGY
ncbi:hypothetical protein DIPPA_19389 [Diplonema papillatum]|nr:hypothetical protein DIPPA_19389 [Diplonema papillatum]